MTKTGTKPVQTQVFDGQHKTRIVSKIVFGETGRFLLVKTHQATGDHRIGILFMAHLPFFILEPEDVGLSARIKRVVDFFSDLIFWSREN